MKMKYFVLTIDEHYVAPMPLEWYGKLNRKAWKGKKVYELPKHYIFYVEKHMQMMFTDIITFPCFMVSEMIRDTIEQYDPSVQFARVVLYDQGRKKSMAYYLPFLEQIEIQGKMIKQNMGILGCTCMGNNKIKDNVLIELTDKEKYYFVVRMDLLESILRRDAIGLGIEEIQIMHEGE